jgi:antitoxin VapB
MFYLHGFIFSIYLLIYTSMGGAMETAKLFKNGKSQAVRLPKEFRFKGEEVYIKKIGDNVVLIPKDNPWEFLLKSLDKFSEDFLSKREQLILEKRKRF